METHIFKIKHSKLRISGTPSNSQADKLSICLSALVLATFIFAYFPVWRDLISAWSGSPENSYGFFIIPISAFLVWKKFSTLSRVPSQGSTLGLLIVIFSLLLYLFAHYAEIITLRSLSIVALLAGAIIYLYGFSIFKELIFPITFLLFMIPIPSQIYSYLTIPLQLFVSKVSVWLAASLGVSVFREGNVIHLPGHTFQVVRACSGMRSMVSLLTLSAVFGYLSLKSNLLRLGLFLSGIPVAIIVNTFRVLLILLAFHYLHADLTRGIPHQALGLLVFIVALLILFMIRGVISPWDRYHTQS